MTGKHAVNRSHQLGPNHLRKFAQNDNAFGTIHQIGFQDNRRLCAGISLKSGEL